jgi:hypothetical protein
MPRQRNQRTSAGPIHQQTNYGNHNFNWMDTSGLAGRLPQSAKFQINM